MEQQLLWRRRRADQAAAETAATGRALLTELQKLHARAAKLGARIDGDTILLVPAGVAGETAGLRTRDVPHISAFLGAAATARLSLVSRAWAAECCSALLWEPWLCEARDALRAASASAEAAATGLIRCADAAAVVRALSDLHADAGGGDRLAPSLCVALREHVRPPRSLHRLLSAATQAAGLATRPAARLHRSGDGAAVGGSGIAGRQRRAGVAGAVRTATALVSWDALRALLASPRFQILDTPGAVRRARRAGADADALRALLAEVALAPDLAPAVVGRACGPLAAHLARWCRVLHALLHGGWVLQHEAVESEGQRGDGGSSGRRFSLEKKPPEVWMSPIAQRLTAQCAAAARLRNAASAWLATHAAARAGSAGRWQRELRKLYDGSVGAPCTTLLAAACEDVGMPLSGSLHPSQPPQPPPPSPCASAARRAASSHVEAAEEAASSHDVSVVSEAAELGCEDVGWDEGTDGLSPWGSPVPAPGRQQLLEFYAAHNPSKLHEVDCILEDWSGQEEVLFACLHKKYGLIEGSVMSDLRA